MELDIPSAFQARLMLIEKDELFEKQQLIKIQKAITEAINKKVNTILFYEKLHENNANKLSRLGYTLKYVEQFHRNEDESYTKISY
jgi:hypothetical protein